MWFMLTAPILDPETQEELHSIGQTLTLDRMRALEKNYGVDHLEGMIILTGDAYDRITRQAQ